MLNDADPIQRRQHAAEPAAAVANLVLGGMVGLTKTTTTSIASIKQMIFPRPQRKNQNHAYTPKINRNIAPGCVSFNRSPEGKKSNNGGNAAHPVSIHVVHSNLLPSTPSFISNAPLICCQAGRMSEYGKSFR